MIIHENGPLPFMILGRAQDGLPFEVWDGTTFWNDGGYNRRSKSSDFLVHTVGAGGYYHWGPFELEDVCEIVWKWKEYKIQCSSAGSTVDPLGESTATSDSSLTSPLFIARGIRVSSTFVPAREVDLSVAGSNGYINGYATLEGRTPDSDFEGGIKTFTNGTEAEYPDTDGTSTEFSYRLPGIPYFAEYDSGYYFEERFNSPKVAKGPDGKYWLHPDSLPGTDVFEVGGNGFVNSPSPALLAWVFSRFSVLDDLRILPTQIPATSYEALIPSYEYQSITVELNLSRGLVTTYLDALKVEYWELGYGDYPAYSFTVTSPKIIFTPTKFFTYGGMYDENTGDRIIPPP